MDEKYEQIIRIVDKGEFGEEFNKEMNQIFKNLDITENNVSEFLKGYIDFIIKNKNPSPSIKEIIQAYLNEEIDIIEPSK